MTSSQLHVVLGSGAAGSTIANQLADSGHLVRLVTRSPRPEDPRIDYVAADLADPEAAVRATSGGVVLYHAANVAYELQVEAMPVIAESVLTAAATHGARLVVLDTLYPYGAADGAGITEQTPWAATSRKGRMRAELDHRYLDAHRAGRVRITLGRAADFFGPRVLNSTLGAAFFPGALTGETALAFGDIELAHSYSFLPDIAAGLITLGSSERGEGRVWHLPTTAAVSTGHVHAVVEELTGRPLEVEVLKEARPAGPFNQSFMNEYAEMFYQHQIAQNMISEEFEREFDQHPTPLRDALASTLAWYRGFLSQSHPSSDQRSRQTRNEVRS